MVDFFTLSKEDLDFKNALVKVGIFTQELLEQDFNEDLDEEFGKEENLNLDEQEIYEKRRRITKKQNRRPKGQLIIHVSRKLRVSVRRSVNRFRM